MRIPSSYPTARIFAFLNEKTPWYDEEASAGMQRGEREAGAGLLLPQRPPSLPLSLQLAGLQPAPEARSTRSTMAQLCPEPQLMCGEVNMCAALQPQPRGGEEGGEREREEEAESRVWGCACTHACAWVCTAQRCLQPGVHRLGWIPLQGCLGRGEPRAGSAAGLGKWPWRNKAGPSQLAFPGAGEVPRQVKVLPNLNSPHGKLD